MPKTSPRNRSAGAAIRTLRTLRGLSPEALAMEITLTGAGPVSGKTIRRIEFGAVPTVRIQFALAAFFDKQVTDLWPVAPIRVAA